MLNLAQDVCMINLVVSTIFSSKEAERKYDYDWSTVTNHTGQWASQYRYEDAQTLLQLSLMVTDTNFEKEDNFSSRLPTWFTEVKLAYDTCPLDIIAKGIPNSHLNTPTTLCRLLYDQRQHVLLIVFTGTSNGCMAGLDLDYVQTDLTEISNYVPGLRGHRGMYNAYKSIRSQLLAIIAQYHNPQVVITGHSLGGALSSLCALDLAYYQPIHYSFASPLFFNPVGCDIFDKLVQQSYRVINLSDMVTQFPLPIMPSGDMYCHTGILVPFQRNLGEYHRNHALAYMIEYHLNFTEVKEK